VTPKSRQRNRRKGVTRCLAEPLRACQRRSPISYCTVLKSEQIFNGTLTTAHLSLYFRRRCINSRERGRHAEENRFVHSDPDCLEHRRQRSVQYRLSDVQDSTMLSGYKCPVAGLPRHNRRMQSLRHAQELYKHLQLGCSWRVLCALDFKVEVEIGKPVHIRHGFQ
jgi:hypothetical protein